MRFIQNQYDPCVYKNSEGDNKTKISTHVDYLKISSTSTEKLEEGIWHLTGIYNEITVHEGEPYDYLGMIMIHDKEKNKWG